MDSISELVIKLHEVLNLIKDFTTGYGSPKEGKMLFVYKGKKYAVKIVEFENPSDNDFTNIRNLKYQI